MLHMAYNATPLNPGGGMTGLIGYLRAWDELRTPMRVSVFASYPKTIAVLRDLQLDIDIIPFAEGVSLTRRMWMQCRQMPRQLEQIGADVVMCTNVALPWCRTPQVTHHRNLWTIFSPRLRDYVRHGRKRVIQALWARYALKHSAANLFISEIMREHAERVVPSSRPRNHVVYNGLDAAALEHARNGCDEWAGGSEIVAVQAPSGHKDNGTLLATMAELARTRPDVDWKLTLAGPGDWSKWQARAAELGVTDRVDFVGLLTMDELDVIYRRSLCLVFPTRFEGFGNPPLEAMSRGCAVVASNCTAMPEVMGDAGVLITPGDAEAFAAAVARLYDDRDHRAALVAAGHQRALQFRWAYGAKKMFEIFERVVADGAER